MIRPAGRAVVVVATVSIVGLIGVVLQLLPGRGVDLELPGRSESVSSEARESAPPQQSGGQGELDIRFQQATVMLHARRYEYALAALDRVLELAPKMSEAHVNRGFALLGLGEPEMAERAFNRALVVRPTQVNAYYGLAVSLDELGDRAGAVGSMRTFVHLSPPADPFVRKARSALWEWQSSASPPLAEEGQE